MATRSMIGFEEFDGTVRGIYCHWDGYVENNGKILVENYNTIEDVEALLDLGNLSMLGSELGEKHDFNGDVENWCKAYGRDRGDLKTEAVTYANRDAFADSDSWCEYFYLFDGNEWFYCTLSDVNWKSVQKELDLRTESV
jgi:hypothetical protein